MKLKVFAATALVCGALAGCVSEPERVESLNWRGPIETPTGREYTPERAQRREQAGWALLWCFTGSEQQARQCLLLAESPAGWDFGEAALRLRGGLSPVFTKNGEAITATPDDAFIVPVFFCPSPGGEVCKSEMRGQFDAFSAQLRSTLKLAADEGCPKALDEARQLGQPAFLRELERACAAGAFHKRPDPAKPHPAP